MKAIDMILYCPNCGVQHIDAPESPRMEQVPSRFAQMHSFQLAPTWDNRPHRSHRCHGCGCIWRPADVATNGVAKLKTSGKDDTWPAGHNDEVRAMPANGVMAPDGSRPKTPTVLCANCGMPIGQHAEDGQCTSPVNDDLSPYWRPSGVAMPFKEQK